MNRSFSIPIRGGKPATIFHRIKFRGLLLQPSHSPFHLAAKVFAKWLAEMTCPHREKNDPRNWSSSGGHSAYYVCNDLREKNRAKVAQKCGVVLSVELEATYRASTFFQRSLSWLLFSWGKNAKITQNKTGKPLRRLDYCVWFCSTAGKNCGAGSRWTRRDPLNPTGPGSSDHFIANRFDFLLYFVVPFFHLPWQTFHDLDSSSVVCFSLHLPFLTILFLHNFLSINESRQFMTFWSAICIDSWSSFPGNKISTPLSWPASLFLLMPFIWLFW